MHVSTGRLTLAEFLYDLNRLNVATSRARCACILVASPCLFEPDCKTPREMKLANGVGRYTEAPDAARPNLPLLAVAGLGRDERA